LIEVRRDRNQAALDRAEFRTTVQSLQEVLTERLAQSATPQEPHPSKSVTLTDFKQQGDRSFLKHRASISRSTVKTWFSTSGCLAIYVKNGISITLIWHAIDPCFRAVESDDRGGSCFETAARDALTGHNAATIKLHHCCSLVTYSRL
jgi:hypothetical protein